MRALPILLSSLLLAGCGAADTPGAPASAPATTQPAGTPATAAAAAAPVPEFPAIPLIVVPEILGVTPAQRALEASMKGVLDPIQGVSIAPARCGSGGALVNDAGITSVDAQGNLVRNGDDGLFRINADGSGTANFEGAWCRSMPTAAAPSTAPSATARMRSCGCRRTGRAVTTARPG